MNDVCRSDVKGEGREAGLPAVNWKSTRLVGARRDAPLHMQWPGLGRYGKAE